MSTTVSYDFIPGTDVFVITEDFTISEGTVLYVKAVQYLVKTLLGNQTQDIVQYVVGLNDGRSIRTSDPTIIHDTFEDAKTYLNSVL